MSSGKVDRDNGIVIGIVADLNDPEKLGRVRVKLQHLKDELSDWAWLVSPMAGKDRGLFLRPEVGDQVLVAFVQGDPRFPYILGSLWSKPDPPPAGDGKPVNNNWRFLKSRSGHLVKLDDTKGAEKIEVTDKSGQLVVRLDSAAKKIQVNNEAGDLEITASTGDVKISSAGGKVTVKGTNVEVSATAELKLTGTAKVTISGGMVMIN